MKLDIPIEDVNESGLFVHNDGRDGIDASGRELRRPVRSSRSLVIRYFTLEWPIGGFCRGMAREPPFLHIPCAELCG